jgi:hypothetical protein
MYSYWDGWMTSGGQTLKGSGAAPSAKAVMNSRARE